MVATQNRVDAQAAAPTAAGPTRAIRPRRGLPGGRAVAGGLLVAVAAVGIFASVSGAGRPPSTRFVVANRDLGVGDLIRSSDLTSVAIDLPARQASHALRSPSAVVGQPVLAPVPAGSIIPRSAVGNATTHLDPTLTLALDTADAVGGALQPGDRVDVFVSYGTGTDSTTRRVVAGCEVIASGKGDGSLGEAGRVEVTLAVAQARERIDLVNGEHAGTITLARVTGARPAASTPGDDQFVEREPAGTTVSSTTPPRSPLSKPTGRG